MSEVYRASGVDLDAAAKAVEMIAEVATRATRPEVREGVGGFAGLFSIGNGRLLAAAADGVGTKLEIARRVGRLDTIGIDLVAMCADDVVCAGAEPLFFLDYLAVGRIVPEDAATIVEGIADGCRRAGCALLGGETAEHPGAMEEGQFDLAGFCLGIVEERHLLGAHRVLPGDVLVGLTSSGLHSNGYSLIRRSLLDRFSLEDVPRGLSRNLAEELLEPTRIYAPEVVELVRGGLVHAAAHVTGGGLPENVARVLPAGMGAEVTRGTWPEAPLFRLVQDAAGAGDADMFATFNMGIGMVLVVAAKDADVVVARSEGAHRIGRVLPGSGFRLV